MKIIYTILVTVFVLAMLTNTSDAFCQIGSTDTCTTCYDVNGDITPTCLGAAVKCYGTQTCASGGWTPQTCPSNFQGIGVPAFNCECASPGATADCSYEANDQICNGQMQCIPGNFLGFSITTWGACQDKYPPGNPLDDNCPCPEDWQCTNWGACTLGQQTRTCTDVDPDTCGTTFDKPDETRNCNLYDLERVVPETTQDYYADDIRWITTTYGEYNSFSQPLSMTIPPKILATEGGTGEDAMSQTVTYGYTTDGLLQSETGPGSYSASYTWDNELRKPKTITPFGGATTTYEYDNYGRLWKAIQEGTSENPDILYTYDISKSGPETVTATSIIDSIAGKDATTTSYYDAHGRNFKTVIQDAGDATKKINTQTDYDTSGRIQTTHRTATGETAGAGTVFSYIAGDPLSRITTITNPDSTTIQTNHGIDSSGKEYTKVMDEENKWKMSSFDGWGNIVTLKENSTDGNNYDYENDFLYTAVDNIDTITDAENHLTDYGYDSLHRLSAFANPDIGSIGYTYDDHGNTRTKTHGTVTMTYTYDELDRLKTINYPSPWRDVTFVYDVCHSGKLCTITEGSGSNVIITTLGYDSFGRLDSITKNIMNEGTYTTTYTYTESDSIRTITYPEGGVTVSYIYNAFGQVEGIEDGTFSASIIYNPTGTMDLVTFGNTVQTDYSYHPSRDWVTDVVTTKLGTTHFSESYIHDDVGNVETITSPGQPNKEFRYDNVHRLVYEDTPFGEATYNYDKAGNRQDETRAGEPTKTYQYAFEVSGSSQALKQVLSASVPVINMQYDERGNLQTKVCSGEPDCISAVFTYDPENRMAAADLTGQGIKEYYDYDYSGLRVRRAVEDVASGQIVAIYHYVYDIMGNMIVENEFLQLNIVPTIVGVTENPNSVSIGEVITFTTDWTDDNPTDLVRAHICRTNAITPGAPAFCTGGDWCESSLDGTSPSTCIYTTTEDDIGTNQYYAFVCDSQGDCSAATPGTFTVEQNYVLNHGFETINGNNVENWGWVNEPADDSAFIAEDGVDTDCHTGDYCVQSVNSWEPWQHDIVLEADTDYAFSFWAKKGDPLNGSTQLFWVERRRPESPNPWKNLMRCEVYPTSDWAEYSCDFHSGNSLSDDVPGTVKTNINSRGGYAQPFNYIDDISIKKGLNQGSVIPSVNNIIATTDIWSVKLTWGSRGASIYEVKMRKVGDAWSVTGPLPDKDYPNEVEFNGLNPSNTYEFAVRGCNALYGCETNWEYITATPDESPSTGNGDQGTDCEYDKYTNTWTCM
ncbi:MAG: hypothetical protein ABIJ92_00960 [Candidatus Aenigmatarchaeota archaeon]